ncbi:MAG TPA: 16S rRNA (cytosine(1402)-N(4))-methyltransferase RsmH [Thermoanaerobaculia bacterium]|nr:16S rRNA (cytosine(1402)-N(4))-methyltransferase RsmH [Thermoanaerobaculia bacterium]
MDAQHVPVLLEETLGFLAPERRPGGLFVDATLGLGGHAEALLRRAPEARLLGLDRDPQALELAARRLAVFEDGGDRVRLEHATFDQLEAVLAGLGIDRVAGVLADLGVSSLQLDLPERGFSFRRDGPLDMRMGIADLTAADLVNQSSEEELERIFREYGEERHARRIARAIARARAETPITTTGQLKTLIDRIKGWASHQEKIDPATRVFQALRIEVNQELAGLEALIDQTVRLLEPDGRLVIISYHSLEDRIVKNRMRAMAQGEVDQVTGRTRSETQLIEALTRKPVRPSEEEIAFNPRSRSAKLRAARRI